MRTAWWREGRGRLTHTTHKTTKQQTQKPATCEEEYMCLCIFQNAAGPNPRSQKYTTTVRVVSRHRKWGAPKTSSAFPQSIVMGDVASNTPLSIFCLRNSTANAQRFEDTSELGINNIRNVSTFQLVLTYANCFDAKSHPIHQAVTVAEPDVHHCNIVGAKVSQIYRSLERGASWIYKNIN
jgi:hypothetical protein